MGIFILQCALSILHAAMACHQGETVEARWIDGTYKVATILEVRDGPAGTCGQYKLSWYHTRVCEDTTHEYYGDAKAFNSFCIVSRDALRNCKEKLCKDAPAAAKADRDSQSSEEASSTKVTMIYVTLGALGLAACCVLAGICCQACCVVFEEVDEEKAGADMKSPSRRGSNLWTISPTSIASSPVAKWFASSPVAKWPSKRSRVAAQPDPIAPVVVKTLAQPELCADPRLKQLPPPWPRLAHGPENLPGGPPEVMNAQESELRQAAREYGAPPQEWRQSRTKSLKRPPELQIP